MILINPKGEKVEFSDEKAKKILKHPGKIKQGWKRFVERIKPKNEELKKQPAKKGRKPKVNEQSNNKD